MGRAFMGTDMSEERSPNLFFPAPHSTECWKEVGFSKDTYVSVDLITSSGPAGKVSG